MINIYVSYKLAAWHLSYLTGTGTHMVPGSEGYSGSLLANNSKTNTCASSVASVGLQCPADQANKMEVNNSH